MIYGNINCAKENISIYPQAIQKAIQYLRDTDLENMAPGKYQIDGDNMFINVMETKTAQRQAKRPEAHIDYIDVQYVVRGCERDYFYTDMGDSEIDEDAYATRDVAFFKPNPNVIESSVVMHAGDYAIFFPSDIHTPACSVGDDMDIKKVIIKVKVDTL